jgi:hypothetical protein
MIRLLFSLWLWPSLLGLVLLGSVLIFAIVSRRGIH